MSTEGKSMLEINGELKINDTGPTGKKGSYGGLTKDQLMNALRLMSLAREIDMKIMKLLRQGKSYFHMSGGGHEAVRIRQRADVSGLLFPVFHVHI